MEEEFSWGEIQEEIREIYGASDDDKTDVSMDTDSDETLPEGDTQDTINKGDAGSDNTSDVEDKEHPWLRNIIQEVFYLQQQQES